MKFTQNTLDKIEKIAQESGYVMRYERGSFQSGYCILQEKKVVVLNKFLPTEAQKSVESTQRVIMSVLFGSVGLLILIVFIGIIATILNNLNTPGLTNTSQISNSNSSISGLILKNDKLSCI